VVKTSPLPSDSSSRDKNFQQERGASASLAPCSSTATPYASRHELLLFHVVVVQVVFILLLEVIIIINDLFPQKCMKNEQQQIAAPAETRTSALAVVRGKVVYTNKYIKGNVQLVPFSLRSKWMRQSDFSVNLILVEYYKIFSHL
jgi:hypothetical protein